MPEKFTSPGRVSRRTGELYHGRGGVVGRRYSALEWTVSLHQLRISISLIKPRDTRARARAPTRARVAPEVRLDERRVK